MDTTRYITQRGEMVRNNETLWISRDGVPFSSSSGVTIKFHTSDENVVSNVRRSVAGFLPDKVRYRGDVCTPFKADVLSFVQVQYSSESGIRLDDGTGPGTLDADTRGKYDSCIELLKTLCRRDHCAMSQENDWGDDQIIHQLCRGRQANNRVDGDDLYLVPSDHVTIVKLEGSNELGVFVSRFWVQRLDDELNFFIFTKSKGSGLDSVVCASISTIGAAVFVKSSRNVSSPPTTPQCKTTGTLGNGTRYYMYRVLLYSDDFNPRSTLFPKGSVGGLYMMPTRFNIRSRRSQATIRTVSVTAAGVSTNSVLEFLINDLFKGSVDVIDCVDAFGERVKVFFDIMGFIGDYPASSAVVDVKCHNATAPCTHCVFTFIKTLGSSMFAYTTTVSSWNSAYRRSQWRTASVREAGMTTFQQKCLGLSVLESTSFQTSTSCPLLKLAYVHNDALRNHTSALHFQSYAKDGYDLNLVAPDHLITGLFKGILLIIFLQLPDDDSRGKLQSCLRGSLTEHGFQGHSMLYNKDKKKLVPGLSMSTLYCILTFLPVTLESLGILDKLPSKRLLLNLHRFFTLVFWWPTVNNDGETAWRFVHGEGMESYYRALQVIAANFVKSVDKFSKSYPSLSSHVDRPNTHRLLKLVRHTIPKFNHILYVSELLFESAHQPLKFFLSRNHTLNSHIYSVHLILARDWMIRMWSLWCIYRDDNENNRSKLYAFLGFIRLIGGHDADKINWKSPALHQVRNGLREHIHHLMIGTVEKRMRAWYHDTNVAYNSKASCVLYPLTKSRAFSPLQCRFYEAAVAELSKLCMKDGANFTLCEKALLHRGSGSRTKSCHERLRLGDVVQLLLQNGFENKTFPSNFKSSKGSPAFFVIGGFIQTKDGTKWALVKHSRPLSITHFSQLPETKLTSFISVRTPAFYRHESRVFFQYIELTEHIRKVGVIQKCSTHGSCDFTSTAKRVAYSQTTLGGGEFYIINNMMAYPPRRS